MNLRDLERRATVLDAREVRDPSAATQALRWVTPGRAQPPDWDASHAFQYGVYSNVVVFACFEAIANTIASLPWRMGPDPEQPENYNAAHPLARMLNYKSAAGPNPEISAFDLWQYSIVQYLATGRFGWEIEDNGEQVAALWPLVSAALVPIHSERGNRYFAGFEYGRRDQPKRLNPDQIVYGWKPSGLDFRQPESALQAAHLDISIAVAQSRYDFAFQQNYNTPAALIITEEFATEEDFAAFKQQWDAGYRGSENAGKAAFVQTTGDEAGGSVDVKILGMSARDTQAAQRYKDRLGQIAMAIGVPWSRLDASGRTFDNASEEDKIWWQQKLIPLAMRLQSTVNIQLSPRFGKEVGWFDLSAVEVLMAKVVPEPLAPFTPVPDDRDGRILDEIKSLRESLTAPVPEVPEPRVVLPPVPDPLIQEVRRGRWRDMTEKRQDALADKWEPRLQRFFTRQSRSVIVRLKSNRGRRSVAGKETRGPAEEIFDPDHWKVEMAEGVGADLVMDSAIEGTNDYLGRIGISFDLKAPGVNEFVLERSNQLAGKVTDTTYRQIKKALGEGIDAGEGVPDLVKRVQHVFDVAKSRATTIARTEVIGAYNGAATQRANTLPADVVAGQEWLATPDGRCRPEHLGANGQVVSIAEAFDVGGEPMAYPGDPNGSAANVINCRCTVAFLTPEEFSALQPRAARKDRAVMVMRQIRSGDTVSEQVLRLALEAA